MFELEGGTDGENRSLIKETKEGLFNKADYVKNKVTDVINTGANYYVAGTCLVIGMLFLLLAFTFLPLILISPAKFNLFFSIGSFFIQMALAFYHGPLAYLKLIFKRENLLISIIYVGTLGLCLYASMFWGTYLSSILLIVLQVRYLQC